MTAGLVVRIEVDYRLGCIGPKQTGPENGCQHGRKHFLTEHVLVSPKDCEDVLQQR